MGCLDYTQVCPVLSLNTLPLSQVDLMTWCLERRSSSPRLPKRRQERQQSRSPASIYSPEIGITPVGSDRAVYCVPSCPVQSREGLVASVGFGTRIHRPKPSNDCRSCKIAEITALCQRFHYRTIFHGMSSSSNSNASIDPESDQVSKATDKL